MFCEPCWTWAKCHLSGKDLSHMSVIPSSPSKARWWMGRRGSLSDPWVMVWSPEVLVLIITIGTAQHCRMGKATEPAGGGKSWLSATFPKAREETVLPQSSSGCTSDRYFTSTPRHCAGTSVQCLLVPQGWGDRSYPTGVPPVRRAGRNAEYAHWPRPGGGHNTAGMDHCLDIGKKKKKVRLGAWRRRGNTTMAARSILFGHKLKAKSRGLDMTMAKDNVLTTS